MKTRLINFFVRLILKFTRKEKKQSILIVKLDEIGDFVIFREQIRNLYDSGYKNITLLGNLVWKDLAENTESKYVDNFIFIDKKRFNLSIIYKFSVLYKVSKLKFDLLIHPTQSRDYYISDFIVSVITSKVKIGFKSDLINSTQNQLFRSNKYYTKLIDCCKVRFEKDKYNCFFKKALNIDFVRNNKIKKQPSKRQCLIFVGASNPSRRWSKYEKLVDLILPHFDRIILCGGGDSKLNFNTKNDVKIVNLINKTTLSEFRTILFDSALLITNESFAHHLAVETQTDCIVISNGNNYTRFHPYPEKYLKSKHIIVYPRKFNRNCDNLNLPSIDDIEEEDVFEEILKSEKL